MGKNSRVPSKSILCLTQRFNFYYLKKKIFWLSLENPFKTFVTSNCNIKMDYDKNNDSFIIDFMNLILIFNSIKLYIYI